MAAYIIADIDVTDPAGFEEYRQQVAPMIAKWGGRYLVRGGPMEKVEGDWAPGLDSVSVEHTADSSLRRID